jgi:hypothetical protein
MKMEIETSVWKSNKHEIGHCEPAPQVQRTEINEQIVEEVAALLLVFRKHKHVI